MPGQAGASSEIKITPSMVVAGVTIFQQFESQYIEDIGGPVSQYAVEELIRDIFRCVACVSEDTRVSVGHCKDRPPIPVSDEREQ